MTDSAAHSTPDATKELWNPETYDALMHKLQSVVERLETGELSLEDSLRAFEDGVHLVRRGEELLTRAEQRIEELLTDGAQDKTVPLEATGGKQAPRASKAGPPRAVEDDDVPF